MEHFHDSVEYIYSSSSSFSNPAKSTFFFEVPFRKNIIVKKSFRSLYELLSNSHRISLLRNFARNAEIIGRIISKHPWVSQWMFQPFALSPWRYNTIINYPSVYDTASSTPYQLQFHIEPIYASCFHIELIGDVFNISASDLKTRCEIWSGSKFSSVNLNPFAFRFFIEFLTCRTLHTLRVLQSYQQVTTMAPPSSLSPRRETAEERHEGDAAIYLLTCFQCSLISCCGRPQGKVDPISRVSALWLIRAGGNCLPHICRMHNLFDCYTFQ